MITKKDATILSHLRVNARKKITEISKKTNIPVTTIYDRVRSQEKRFIKKHTALIDFTKIGYAAKAMIEIRPNFLQREEVEKYLIECPNVNSLYRINDGHDFLLEGVFRNFMQMQRFLDQANVRFKIKDSKIYNIVDEIKKEEFLTKEEDFNHFDIES